MNGHVPTWVFRTGDAITLVVLNALGAALTMYIHDQGGDNFGTFAMAVTAGMLVPMALARLLAVVLGSIETMVPMMASGMATMPLVCGAVMLGVASVQGAILLGAVVGLATFVRLHAYSRACPRQLAREIE